MPSNRTRFILKIVLLVSAISAFGIGLYLAICMFSGITNYFTSHIGLGLALIILSLVPFTLPVITKKKYADDSKDKYMFLVGVLLIMFGILTIVLSYFNIFGW